ncbi:hypothetical protein HKD37_08G022512 [Glycine soja]
MIRQKSRGSTNITGEEDLEVNQSDSWISFLVSSRFLMHHMSSAHENFLQCGTASLTGSLWPSSATMAPQPPSSLAMLCTNPHRDFISCAPHFPSMCSP